MWRLAGTGVGADTAGLQALASAAITKMVRTARNARPETNLLIHWNTSLVVILDLLVDPTTTQIHLLSPLASPRYCLPDSGDSLAGMHGAVIVRNT